MELDSNTDITNNSSKADKSEKSEISETEETKLNQPDDEIILPEDANTKIEDEKPKTTEEPNQTTNLLHTVQTTPAKKHWKQRIADATWKHRNFSKVVHTIILYSIMLGMGSMHTVVGPTLLDLAFKLDATVSEISVIYIAQGVGFMVGTIAGGVLIDVVPKMVFLMVVTAMTAGVTVSIPHWPSVWSMCICFFLRGASIRALEIGCNVTLLALWGIRSSRPMQGLHFFLAIGCAIGPLIVQPFLGETVEAAITHDNATQTSTVALNQLSRHARHVHSSVVVNDLTSSEIELAYLTIGCYLSSIVIIAVIAYIIAPRPRDQLEKDQPDSNLEPLGELSAKLRRSELSFKIRFILTGTIILFLYFGSILSFDSFLTTFCVESKLRMSQSKGALLTTVFWCAFILARMIACFYAGAISDLKIIIVDIVGIVLSSVPMSFFVEHHQWLLWVCIVFYGFFMASLGPAAISYTNMYIDVSGKTAAFYMLGAAVGETVAPLIIGKLFVLEPMVLMYTVTTISVLLIPLTILAVKIAHKRGKRSHPNSRPSLVKRRSSLYRTTSECNDEEDA